MCWVKIDVAITCCKNIVKNSKLIKLALHPQLGKSFEHELILKVYLLMLDEHLNFNFLKVYLIMSDEHLNFNF